MQTANSALQQRPKHASSHCVNSSAVSRTNLSQVPLLSPSGSLEPKNVLSSAAEFRTEKQNTTKGKVKEENWTSSPWADLTPSFLDVPNVEQKSKQTRNKKSVGDSCSLQNIIITPDNGHETSLTQTLVPSNT